MGVVMKKICMALGISAMIMGPQHANAGALPFPLDNGTSCQSGIACFEPYDVHRRVAVYADKQYLRLPSGTIFFWLMAAYNRDVRYFVVPGYEVDCTSMQLRQWLRAEGSNLSEINANMYDLGGDWQSIRDGNRPVDIIARRACIQNMITGGTKP